MATARAPHAAFTGTSWWLLAAGTAVAIAWCASAAATGEMAMHGGGAMATPWRRAPAQTWPGTALSFLGMWVAMTAAMMLPVAAPALWRRHRAVAGGTRGLALGALTAAAYVAVWTLVGIAVFPLGATLSAAAMAAPALARAAPIVVGAIVVTAGACQLTAWKAPHLARCREAPRRAGPPFGARAAWTHGVRLGRHCVRACANLMAVPVAVDIMDVRLMAAVGVVIAVERLVPAGERVARATGVGIVAAGASLIVRAVTRG